MILLGLACAPPSSEVVRVGDLELGPVQTCDAPSPVAWDEVGAEWGLPDPVTPVAEAIDGMGLVLAHVDGQHVLWTGFPGQPVRRLLLDGRSAAAELEVSAAFSLSGRSGSNGMTLVIDGRVDGDVPPDSAAVRDVVWVDLDGDGTDERYLVRTNGDFTDALWDGAWSDVDGTSQDAGFSGHALDWDEDGDLDVAVFNDSGFASGVSRLFRNDDGHLVDVGGELGFDLNIAAMGGSFGDFDGDGDRDVFVAAANANRLYRNVDGVLVEVPGVNVLEPQAMGWGSAWLDHDNDGRLDLLVAEGDLWYGDQGQDYEAPLELLVQTDDGVFVDRSLDLGLAQEGSHRAVLAHDLNEDGVLDLVVAGAQTRALLYMSRGCSENGWLEVHAPEHARVDVTTSRTQTRWIQVRPGFYATQPETAWFGLGADGTVESVRVTELDGTEHELLGPFEGRRTIRLD